MKGIYWLASYPKSGNTWTRAFLANLVSEGGEQVEINQLATGSIGSNREWVQEALGIEISELNHEEVDRLRPLAYQWIADHNETGFHKIHDAYTYLENDEPLIPRRATRGVVYLLRNPMDVAVSLANHSNIKVQAAVDQICDPEMAFCHSRYRLPSQLRQILMSWSEHVQSWLSADIPQLVCRYEDIQLDPRQCFTRIASFLEIKTAQTDIDGAIDKAIAASTFEKLRAQEDAQGFDEKISGVENFFRKGIVGDWREQLTEKQIVQIVESNKDVMQTMGYLDDAGNITALATGESCLPG